MLFVPTNTSLDPVLTVVFPAVFPPVETPAESTPCVCTVWAGAEMEIVEAPAAVACERVISPAPASTIREPVFTVVWPAVLPPLETPALSIPWVCVVCALTDSWYWFPVVERIVMAPSSDSETVPDVYVVWEFAIPEMPV